MPRLEYVGELLILDTKIWLDAASPLRRRVRDSRDDALVADALRVDAVRHLLPAVRRAAAVLPAGACARRRDPRDLGAGHHLGPDHGRDRVRDHPTRSG